MVYPKSPFLSQFNELSIVNYNNTNSSVKKLSEILSWICQTPKITSFRVNTLKYSTETVKDLIKKELYRITNNEFIPIATIHPILSDVILIESNSKINSFLQKFEKEVIVDAACGSAVLRGAHIFAPGVMAMQTGTKIGDQVSVYSDISKKCKRGMTKIYDSSEKVFVGNGIVKMVRNEIFRDNLQPTGVAVEIIENISGCPTLSENNLPVGTALLQNFPSIVCGYVLNPKIGDLVLDMCASPGNKTSHLAALMKNKGTIVALDKTANKIKQLKKRCDDFSLDNVYAFEFDSTKSCNNNVELNINNELLLKNGPPFPSESFDKILLDAPCSGLGNRPQLVNAITNNIVRSYVPLQRKLFTNAVSLLKKGGHLVYSTCTLTIGENEGIVAWALENFDCLELNLAEPLFGGPGWPGTNLTSDQLEMVQRFGSNQKIDSIGFFIAHFVKKS